MHPPTALALVLIAACGVAQGGDQAAGQAEGRQAAAPALEGKKVDGGDFSLDELRGKNVVVVFYRGLYCGLCRERLRHQAMYRDAYEALGARTIAVVPGAAAGWREFADSIDADFPIIVVDRATLQRWGTWPAGERAPQPAVYIVDDEGRIRFRHVGRTAADRVSDPVLLAEVRRPRRPSG